MFPLPGKDKWVKIGEKYTKELKNFYKFFLTSLYIYGNVRTYAE